MTSAAPGATGRTPEGGYLDQWGVYHPAGSEGALAHAAAQGDPAALGAILGQLRRQE